MVSFVLSMKKQKWYIQQKSADFVGIGKKYNIDPIIARLIRNKDIIEDKDVNLYINGSRTDMYDPFLLKGIGDAVELIHSKIEYKKRIRIIGDYDIDGVMSTYILVSGLRKCGGIVDYAIPHRVVDGYGLNVRLIQEAIDDGIDTIITCDNGIAAIDEIAFAKENGITVIVTDHHEISFSIDSEGNKQYIFPNADVIIDPKTVDETYPFIHICGAVVAYKLIQAYWINHNIGDAFEYIEMAAFATIGDVMELIDENRIIVKEGLKKLSNTDNIGLKSLIEATAMGEKKLTPYHVGFVLGPCINATGRLDSAQRALELLLTDSVDRAREYAKELVDLNVGRKDMTNAGVQEAINIIESNQMDKNDDVLVVYLPEVHESIAGIIAGKIKERYYKPVFILTDSENGIKGSGRSIESYDMYEKLSEIKELFTKFGGHKMAAGVSLLKENLEVVRKRLNELSNLCDEDFVEKISIDVALPFSFVTKQLIKQFSVMEPFGNGNSKPVFARKSVTVLNKRIFGKNNNVGKYTVRDEDGTVHTLIYFGAQDELWERIDTGIPIKITYYPDINVYNGREEIQFVLKDYL